MATDASLGLQEICHESLDKSDITYSNEDETLHFVSESHEEDLTDESGLDLQETSNNSPDIEDVELSHDQRDEGTINTTRASTTALDTLVHTACQDVNHHTTCSEMSVNSTVAVTTSSLLDSSVPSTASSISSSEHSLEENNAIMGTMLDSNMIAAVSQAVRGTGVNVLSLPTMAFKQIDTPSQSSEESYSIQDETMDSDSNEDSEDFEEEELENLHDGIRKSVRKRKPPRPRSPEEEPKVKRKRKRSHRVSSSGQLQPETPFKCDKCGSPYVTNPSRRGNRLKTSSHQPSPRHKIDPITGRTLTLCNACGLSFDRPKKPHREKILPTQDDKNKYLEEAKKFAKTIADDINDPDAERLYCPLFKSRACGCLQKYIMGSDNELDTNEAKSARLDELLDFMKQARELAKEKCYDLDEIRNRPTKSKRSKNIGLGNGQRKSKAFEDFVLDKRKYLRETLKLCERATQKVLLYSNNFLHKKLKTDPTKAVRIERKKGKAALGKLKPFDELQNEKCCVDNCITIAQSHSKLLQQWRDRAVSGQTEARRVLAEMLTPSGGARSNCYKFISWVTGCSHSTIGRVNEQMKQTSGDREPPTHGLIRWWKEHPKPKKQKPVKHVPQPVDTVQQVALQQIQQTSIPQVANILQAAVSSAGLTAVMMPSMATTVPLGTVSTNALSQPQISTIMLNNGTIQIQTQGTQQVATPQVQQIQLQQQQYEQQLQQLQLQAYQLQQQQQQIQQRLQQTQQQLQQAQQHQQHQQLQQTLQHCLPPQVTLHTAQQQQQQQIIQTQAQEIHVVQQHPQIVQQDNTQRDVQQDAQQTVANIPVSNIVTVAIPTSMAVSQATSLNNEPFLSPEVLQLALNQIPPHLVIPVSTNNNVTQAVPVSLIQTTQNSL